MQLEARMACQPALDGRMFMGGVIVQNDVDMLAQRNFPVDLLEKFQPLAVGVFLGGLSDDFALQIIQRGKEGDRTVAVVIVGLGADMPFAKRQTRLAALKSLDLAFLVTTEHHSLLGRIEVKTDDIPELRLKVWIGGKLKDTRQVRLDFVVTPDPLHGRLGDSQLAGHRAASPSRPAPRWPRGLINDLAQDLRAKPAFAARGRLPLQTPKPASDISPSPLCDLVKVHADPRSDGTNSHTLGCQLYDSRSLCQPLRGALGAYQTAAIALLQRNSTRAFHAAWTSKHPSTLPSECHYYLRDTTLVSQHLWQKGLYL